MSIEVTRYAIAETPAFSIGIVNLGGVPPNGRQPVSCPLCHLPGALLRLMPRGTGSGADLQHRVCRGLAG